MALAAILLPLLAVEVGLRWFAPQPLSGTWLIASSAGYNLNRPSAKARHAGAGRSVDYRFNALGFRGGPPADARLRVLVLGDSITFGWLLEEPDTSVARIAAAAAGEWGFGTVEFMNASVGGWGAAEYVAFTEDHGSSTRPGAVLVVLSGAEVRRAMASGLWTMPSPGSQAIERRRVTPPFYWLRALNKLPGYGSLLEHSQLAQLSRRALIGAMSRRLARRRAELPAANVADGLALTQALFRRLKAWCETRGVPLWVVTTGAMLMETPSGDGPENPDRVFLDQARTFFPDLGVPYLDLLPAMRAADSTTPLLIADDGHPNEAGASLIASLTWPWLRDRLAPVLAIAPASHPARTLMK